MRFPPHFLDEIRSRLSVSEVVSQRVKLKRQGREFTGLSPFKQEKTPSFTVNDQKAFYHCFATGEHGDIFTFLMKTQGLSFPEAVENLANQAGVPIPQNTPEDIQRTEKNERLRMLTEQSAKFFRNQLESETAGEARQYLNGRGLDNRRLQKFKIGYAPNSRTALKEYLLGRGFTMEEIILSGMAIGGPEIKVPYDRFRRRIMFPIEDLKGRIIAFGGRALDANVPAKYLNSPETPIFHKGYQLYNAAAARKTAHEKERIIVVEGYMDVIALDGAGIENAVAPLGTALTGEQIQLLWRMAPEPTLCFDGDVAGQKAAHRAVDTVLPLLKPGLSLKFAFLPDGQDPDDLINAEGDAAISSVIERAEPLSNVLWKKEFQSGDWSTPERRAALEKQLYTQINTIADTTVRGHYTQELKSRLWNAFKPNQKTGNSWGRASEGYKAKWINKRENNGARFNSSTMRQQATSSLIDSNLVKSNRGNIDKQEELILVTLLNHSWLLETEAEQVANLSFSSQSAKTLRDALLEAQITQNSLDRERVQSHLEKLDLYSLAAQMQRKIAQNGPKYAKADANLEEVKEGWHHLMMCHHKAEELKQELESAERAFREEDNQQNFDRLKLLREALHQSLKQAV